jgi:hypothetical protein
VNPTDEQSFSQRLHDEIGSLTVPPAPAGAVRQRGRAIKARRRAFAAGAAALAVAVAVVSVQAISRAPQPSQPLVSPPGGVFAPGVTDGKPWQLAVRNIAADPGTRWCLPAVMLNGHDGDILQRSSPRAGNLQAGFVTDVPGLRDIGFGYFQLSAGVTRVVYRFASGRTLTERPVAVTACGHRLLLSGFAYTFYGVMEATIYSGHSSTHGGFPLPDADHPEPHARGYAVGIWGGGLLYVRPLFAATIGHGTAASSPWTIKESLGASGQCYAGVLPVNGLPATTQECLAIGAPPRAVALAPVQFAPGGAAVLTGYAGLVNPRAAYVTATLSNGTTLRLVPVNVAGRAYLALAVPQRVTVTRLVLHDRAGQAFASVPGPPRAG